MNRYSIPFVVFTLSLAILLTSCTKPEVQIIGLWSLESNERTFYEEGEISATATYYYTGNDDGLLWEFQEDVMLVYEEKEMELEESYTWNILSDDVLVLTEEGSTESTLEILKLTSKEMIVQEEDYTAGGSGITGYKSILYFVRVEE